MAAPSFIAASTGSTDTGGAFTATCHAPGAAGRIIILQVFQDGTTDGALTFTSATNIENLAGTDNAWTAIGEWTVGASDEGRHYLWVGRSLSTSAPTFTGGNSTSEDPYWRFYEFTDVATFASGADTLAEVIEGTLLNYIASTTDADFGYAAIEQRAQSFSWSAATTLKAVTVPLSKGASPSDNLVIEIQSDSSGSPSGSVAGAVATIAGSALTTTRTNYTYSCEIALSASTTYWLVFRRSGALDGTNFYKVGYHTTIYAGSAQKSLTSGAWNSEANDLALWISGTGGAGNEVGTSATAADAGVTTLGPDRLALNFVAVNDDNAISAFTGETGGDWAHVTDSPYAESSGTDGAIALQAAYIGSPSQQAVGSADVIYGGTGTNEQLAQSFASGSGGTVGSVYVHCGKNSAPTDNLIVEIQTNSAGAPSGTVVSGSTVTIPGTSLGGSAWVTCSMTASLSASTTYWLVFRRDGSRDTTNSYNVSGASSDVYASGVARVRDSGAWNASALIADLGFVIGYGAGTINGGTGSIVDSDAWGVVGFALIGTTVTEVTYVPRNPGIHFNDPALL